MRGRSTFSLENILLALFLLPVILFLITWFRYSVGIPSAFALSLFFWRLLRTDSDQTPFPKWTFLEWALLLSGALVWVGLSGTGGIGYQNWDHVKHNAMLNDLILNEWPVRYGSDSATLVYYIPFYLIPALIGKAAGWTPANILLWIQYFIFVTLILIWITQRTGAKHFAVLPAILIIMFFSGNDWIAHTTMGGPPPLHRSLEWWNPFTAYLSITTQLFWTPNSALAAWTGTILLLSALNRETVSRAFFICLLVFYWCPYVFFGIFPFLLLFIPLKGSRIRFLSSEWRWMMLLIPASILAIVYYSAKSDSIPVDSVLQNQMSILALILSYISFVFLEILWLFPFFWYFKTKRAIDENSWRIALVAFATLMVIPLMMSPSIMDFIMKASMGPIFIIAICLSQLVVKYIDDYPNLYQYGRSSKYIMATMIFVYIFGSITAIHEIGRGVHHYNLITQNFQPVSQVPLLEPENIAKQYLGNNHFLFKPKTF